jgi:hypothetical protein
VPEVQTPEALDAGRVAGAKRWCYIPGPNRTTDLEKIRELPLLSNFDTHRQSVRKKRRAFRLEPVCTSLRVAWGIWDYATIPVVAKEELQLLMSPEHALVRSGTEA